jgi:arylsulfatase A-like enzyme
VVEISDKMNVLFIITDQQRKDHLSCYGNNVLRTPNIDKIAEDGVKFSNYFCTTPICMPNRASFLTGAFPSIHGTRSNGINLNPEIPTVSDILRRKGYHTVSIGKCHFNFFGTPTRRKVKSWEKIIAWLHKDITSSDFPSPYYGFNEVLLTAGHGDWMAGHYSEWLEEKGWDQRAYAFKKPKALNENYYETELTEELYPTNYVTERTIEFLEHYKSSENADKPFFLHCSYPDPHHPVCPPGRYKDLYSPEDIQVPSTFSDVENLLKHEFLGPHLKNARFRQLLPQMIPEEDVKKFIALTYGSISMIDDGVGKILNMLEKVGEADNTMVIFTSDHGDLCGDHGMILKGPAHYRGLINIPLIWNIPGLTKKSESHSLVSTIDLPKTILGLLNIKSKKLTRYHQGVDITPVLREPIKKVRDRILIEHDEEIAKDKIMRLLTLVNENYRITLYNDFDKIGDIFNLKEDPNELYNLWSSNNEVRNRLVEELLRESLKVKPRLPRREAYN